MKRIAFAEGFRQIVDSGLTREAALNVLNEERTTGLRVWCNGRLMMSSEVRDDLCFVFDLGGGKFGILELNPNDASRPPVVYPASPGIGWDPYAYVFEVDAAQIETLIAKLRKPLVDKPRKPSGRHPDAGRQLILKKYDWLVRKGEVKPAQGAHAWATHQVRQGKLKSAPHQKTIERWVRERERNEI